MGFNTKYPHYLHFSDAIWKARTHTLQYITFTKKCARLVLRISLQISNKDKYLLSCVPLAVVLLMHTICICSEIESSDSHQSISCPCIFNQRGEVVTNTHQSCQLYASTAKVKSIANGLEWLKIIGHQNRRQIRTTAETSQQHLKTNWTISRDNRFEN